MKKGLIGYMFDYGPNNPILNFFWRLRKKLGLKVKNYGIPIIVSDKVTKDETIVFYKT